MIFLDKSFIKRLKYFTLLAVTLFAIGLLLNNSTSIIRSLYPIKYKEPVLKYARENNIDPLLVFAIIKAESSFNPTAISHKNARGLMQISEITAKWGAETLEIQQFNMEDLYDPDLNIRIGCWYIGRLMKEFDNNMDLVIAAYNGGSGNVNEWLKNKNYSNSGKTLEKIPFKETDKFLNRVKSYYSAYKRHYEGTL